MSMYIGKIQEHCWDCNFMVGWKSFYQVWINGHETRLCERCVENHRHNADLIINLRDLL